MTDPTRRLLPHQPPNLRDTGGLRTRDGQRIRHGRLLRSASLAQLAAETARELTSYISYTAGSAATGHASAYLDLRTDREVAEGGEPTALIEQGWTWEHIPLSDRDPSDEESMPEDQLQRYLRHLPRYIEAALRVTRSLSEGQPRYGRKG